MKITCFLIDSGTEPISNDDVEDPQRTSGCASARKMQKTAEMTGKKIIAILPNDLVCGLNVPKVHKMIKQDCIDYLQSKHQVVEQVVEPTMSAIELKSLVKMYIKENIPIEVVRTAEESPLQHSVLFLPSHHSDLIPLSWHGLK